ncbi:MAG: hypothetical protein LBO78_00940 [Rickettsiales bacterium]|nr:hypothetical protein [Rickettsiales bacterium]
MFKNWNWKTPVLDLMLLMVTANLTIFYDDYVERSGDYWVHSGHGEEYWYCMIAAFFVLSAIKIGSLAFFAAKEKKAGGK